MDTQTMENCKCPICVEVFSAAVYQCRNGHLFCSNCSTRITSCPECRIALDFPRIRNRFAENVLDGVKFDCEYQKRGCKEKLLRWDVPEHSKKCSFRHGWFKLCKLLGFSCDYLSCTKDIVDVCKHLKNIHKVNVDENCKIRLNIGVKLVISADPKITSEHILLTNTTEYIAIVLLQISNSQEDNSVKFNCVGVAFSVDGEGQHNQLNRKVKFVIKSPNGSEIPDVNRSSEPFELAKLCVCLKQLSFRVPYQAFLKYSKYGYVTVDFSVE